MPCLFSRFGNQTGGGDAKNGDDTSREISLAIDFTAADASGNPWTLSDHLDAAAVITFHRGDF